jgi:hypothetical protein
MAQYRKDNHSYLNDGKTIFEAMMLADQYGNIVGAANPTGMAVDAFGRARMSTPYTLFDSVYKYSDNGEFATSNTAGGTFQFNANESTVSLTVDGATTNSEVLRETYKVFSYQPGKSLLTLNSFVMNTPTEGIRQRAGYFSATDGIFLELDGTELSFVIRSNVTGSIVENRVTRNDWIIDKLDGFGPSGYTLDISKAQILFTDIEWLGVGSVRIGFVIDGRFIHCHTFHHANIAPLPYMSSASLPVRFEIKNVSASSGSYTLRHICSSVISEGGYRTTGRPFAIGIPVQSPRDMPTAGTYIPAISIRLKSGSLDGIAVPKNFSLVGVGNATRIAYRLVNGPSLSLTGANWVSAGNNSLVEYDISATALTGGDILLQGYTAVTNQSASPITLIDGDFRFQLQRNSFTSTPQIFTIASAGAANGDDIVAAIGWEEL